MRPLISIIIPVYRTEKVLERCLKSVISQTLRSIEILVVDDGSIPTSDSSEKCSCRMIVDKYSRMDNRIRYISHAENRGLLEARRSGFKKAKGKYILAVDSDDVFAVPEACQILYDTAEREEADVVQCGVSFQFLDPYPLEKCQQLEKVQRPWKGILRKAEIFENCFLESKYSFYIYAKLVKRSLYQKVYALIPEIYCVLGEDFLHYFFISYYAEKYIGIPERLYTYSVGEGISTTTSFTSLEQWKAICSAAFIFPILFSFLEKRDKGEKYLSQLRKFAQSHLYHSIKRWEKAVTEELKKPAYEALCEAWGRENVFHMQEIMEREETEGSYGKRR